MTQMVQCPSCKREFKVKDEFLGRKGKCPSKTCQSVFVLKAKATEDEDDFMAFDVDEFDDSEIATKPLTRGKTSKTSTKVPVAPPRMVSRAKPTAKKKNGKGKSNTSSASIMMPLMIGFFVVVGLSVVVASVMSSSHSDSGSTPTAVVQTSGDTANPSSGEAGTVVLASNKTELTADVPLGFKQDITPFFEKYCYDCHGPDSQEGGLNLSLFKTEESLLTKRKAFEHVFDHLRIGSMPPADSDLPPDALRQRVLGWLEQKLFHLDCVKVDDPGRVTVRRLNRTEYNNTMRDLIGIDMRPADDFPSDEVGYGFDTIGDVLTLSPLLMERYLDASEKVLSEAILCPETMKKNFKIDIHKATKEGGIGPNDNGLIYFAAGKLSMDLDLKMEGEFTCTIQASADQAGTEKAKMEVFLDGKSLKVVTLLEHKKIREYPLEIKVPPGKHVLRIDFINDFYDDKATGKTPKDRNMSVFGVNLFGPHKMLSSNYPPSHKKLIISVPSDNKAVFHAAEDILNAFMPRAYRRPVSSDEVSKYVKLVEMVVNEGESFERGVQIALEAVLVSPDFIYRIEKSEAPDDPKAKNGLTDFELASRLSYFLWSSMPDDELFELAKGGTLHLPAVLEAQTRRMLKDKRADALVVNFAGQWLGLRKLDEVDPDRQTFTMYNDKLKRAMWKETELFFAAVKNEDRNVLDFLDGDFTFVNEPLAKLYGIPDVQGDAFKRVSLAGTNRAGILTQSSILTITSFPTRTSPVKRGEWILANILGQAPPPAPPVVPDFETTIKANPNLSLRQQLEIHRKDPGCASCHKVMDSIGFGFENFDAIGQWREKDGSVNVDSSGALPNGQTFQKPTELVKLLRDQKRDFIRCLVEKMLTYGLGRGIEFYDRCAVDTITQNMEQEDNHFSRMIVEVVKSKPFRMRRGDGGDVE
jgi:hypothetical protein